MLLRNTAMFSLLTAALAAEADKSFDDIQSEIYAALRVQFGETASGANFYPVETFPEYVIAQKQKDMTLWRIPYTVKGNAITFGDAQEVEEAYVPAAAESEFLAAEGAQNEDGVFPIRIIKAGWATGSVSVNGVQGASIPHYYPPEFVAQVAEAAKSGSVPFGRIHPDQKGPDPTGSMDASRIAGYVEGGSLVGGDEAHGFIRLLSAESDLRSRLSDAQKAKKKLFAVSALMSFGGRVEKVDGKDAFVAKKLGQLYSVDLCARAGAGGAFLTPALSASAAMTSEISAAQLGAVKPSTAPITPRGQHETSSVAAGAKQMKDQILKLLNALKARDAAKAATLSLKLVTAAEAELLAIFNEAADALAVDPGTQTAVSAEAAATATLREARQINSRNRIDRKLAESKLPKAAIDYVRPTLENMLAAEAGGDLSDERIDAEVTRARTAFAAFEGTGRVSPGYITPGLDSQDKIVLAMEATLGIKSALDAGAKPFRSLKEAYTVITGDRDFRKLGTPAAFTGSVLAAENAASIATGDFPNILLNSMTKKLDQDYADASKIDGLDTIYETASISDFKSQDRVRDGYFPELATVNENATYQEIAHPTDERVSYSVAKRGNLLTISEETIRNDDLGAIQRFPGRLARAARQTLSSYITNFFTANGAYQADGLTWFHATHNNLQSAAISVDALIAAEIALALQTEMNSGEALGLTLDWLMVPVHQYATACAINQTDTAGSNQFFHRFGVNNERILRNHKLDAVDTNDWYYGTNRDNAPCLEIGFLDGIQTPQIFVANQPTVGQMFTADQIQYKVKFPFGGVVKDFRGVGKSVVSGS